MAAGDLSADQARYVQLVSQGTGLDSRVVTAWVGAESGWSINKPTHNYLNIGPGKGYTSADQAAAAAVNLVNSSGHYAGIRASKVQGAEAQLNAIGASPWGTIGSTLKKVYASTTDVRISNGTGGFTPVGFTLPDWVPFVGGEDVPSPGEAIGGVADSVADSVAKVGKSIAAQLLEGSMTLILGTGGIALTGLGLYKLASASKSQAAGKATGNLGQIGDLLSVVPIPQAKGAGAALSTASKVGNVASSASKVGKAKAAATAV